MSVTIIIPVFNGHDYIQRLANCDGLKYCNHDVIFINDSSSDPRIASLLLNICKANDHFHYSENRRNLGFVGTVNKGLMMLDNSDVILLNSDTLVGVGWVEELASIKLMHSKVATISPLSNAAGFFSIPNPRVNNTLPEGLSLEDCRILLKSVVEFNQEETPTSCGFCQYITREAIDEVGYFDDNLFYKGYGEETDFCLRAEKRGFKNFICLSEFVFHEREVSFGESKSALKKQNSAILKAMHPDFLDRLVKYETSSLIPGIADKFSKLL